MLAKKKCGLRWVTVGFTPKFADMECFTKVVCAKIRGSPGRLMLQEKPVATLTSLRPLRLLVFRRQCTHAV